MIARTIQDLPSKYRCRLCGAEKEITKMIMVRRKKTRDISLRPRCKDCHNKRERGHRREWKRNYLRRWREYNPELTESYWKTDRAMNREKNNELARRFVRRHHHAILIQGRLRRRASLHVNIAEATALLKKYGPCYPTRFGLTRRGLRECERIRSRIRSIGKQPNLVEIRLAVYEDGYFIKPERQSIPYQIAAGKLREWQASRRLARR